MTTQQKAIVTNTHLPEKLAVARALIQRGFSLILQAQYLTDELKIFAKLPMVQLRFCRTDYVNAPPQVDSAFAVV